MARLDQLDTTARHQALAPEATIFVAASAGSGKTKVLTDRLLRLLGEGVPPSAILCLTFTKAAALEMRERLMAALKDMAVKDELTLFRTLQDLSGRPPQGHELSRARLLFTQVLDTPGGLQLMTLHSFCQQLLQRFPIEAGLTPGFRVMDESEAQTLLIQAMEQALTAPDVAAHLQILVQRFSSDSLQELIINAINATPNELGLSLDDFPHTAPDLKADAEVNALQECILGLRRGSEADIAFSVGMDAFWQAPDETAFASYTELFLTQKGEVRARLVSKKLQDVEPEILQVLQREADRVQRLLGELRDYRAGQVSRSLSALVRSVAQEFDYLKRRHNCVNYDDLIRHSLHLLRRSDLADWVRFKLDRRLAHLLVDEAQDTSALQWQLVGALAEEFYTGHSQTETPKSLFLVGDLKQSIYGFQGAAPELFKAMGHHYTRAAQEAGQGGHIIELTHSFRSSPAVLQAVDAVFAQPHMAHHVQALPHLPMREGHAGTVELWPLMEGDHEWQTSSRLAKDLARELRQWFQEGRLLPARGRPVTPGDVLILVQRRQGFIGQLTRALKREGVPVAGPDRIELSQNIAVQDLIALGHFLVLPNDDVNLALILKSPLCGVAEDDLFDLAFGRGEQSLFDVLKSRAHQHQQPWQEVYAFLRGLLGLVDNHTPYQLYHHIIAERRHAFAARLGPEIHEILDEFLRAVQEDEGRHLPSLQLFLHHFARLPQTLKRETSARGAGEVRIMTVHGAKGLQAPVVIVADTSRVPQTVEGHLKVDESTLLWLPPAAESGPRTESLKDYLKAASLPEYYRLLYVAMTRAEDELYICGWRGGRTLNEQCWHRVIETGLQDFARENGCTLQQPNGRLRLSHQQTAPLVVERQQSHRIVVPQQLPEYLLRMPHEVPETTSDLARHIQRLQSGPSSDAQARGALVHKVLHALTTVPEACRMDTIERMLAPLGQEEAVYWAQTCRRLLEDPRGALLFTERSLSEVSVAGYAEDTWIEGRLDRLVVFDDEVWVVDFKTDGPWEKDTIPMSYRRQLARYAHLVRATYPQKICRTFLLCLKTAQWLEI